MGILNGDFELGFGRRKVCDSRENGFGCKRPAPHVRSPSTKCKSRGQSRGFHPSVRGSGRADAPTPAPRYFAAFSAAAFAAFRFAAVRFAARDFSNRVRSRIAAVSSVRVAVAPALVPRPVYEAARSPPASA